MVISKEELQEALKPFYAKRFPFEETLKKIGEKGFRWEDFREIFPFGGAHLLEGQYQRLVEAALESLPNDRERILLLDLLDAQWCVYFEQIWIAHKFCGDPGRFVTCRRACK
jgi:hypothetical protein